MSIECSRRMDYLQNDCDSKGIHVTPSNGVKLTKDDYIKALREWWLKKRFGNY